ncbi:MAG: M28 family metallopeptidase [Gammaproteobacteria bacterium]|nr:M28 family metallopeptidase [Gammaproteobacteria bacterium]
MRKLVTLGVALAGTLVLLAACQPQTGASKDAMDYASNISADNIRAHMEFLADDLMQGRDTGEPGYEISANYVATFMKLYGLKPGNGDSFFQSVPFRSATVVESSASLTLAGETMELDPVDDLVITPSNNEETASAEGGLVFVGYGIHAPDFGYSSYEGLDVEGKYVVMVRRGAPDDLPSDERAYFSSTDHKYAEAQRRGAIGVITLTSPSWREAYGWDVISRWVGGGSSFNWVGPEGNVPMSYPDLGVRGWLSYDMTDKLFEASGHDYEEVIEQLGAGELVAFDVPGTLTASVTSEWESISSRNVVGVLEGSDPALKEEYVLFSGHLDHTGVRKSVAGSHAEGEAGDGHGDLINNGAYDNASGIAILLEIMRVYSNMETRPRRSMVFLAVTAEEKGLLGSEYWGANPTLDIDKVSANVNLDMPILTFPIADVVGYGVEHSELHEIVEEKAGMLDLALSPDPKPEEVIFVRSDQYSFVKEGVPAVFLVPGFNSRDEAINGEEAWEEFSSEHYHKPSDDLSLPYNKEAAFDFAATNFLVGLEVANRDKRVEWKDNFFGRQFGPLREQ